MEELNGTMNPNMNRRNVEENGHNERRPVGDWIPFFSELESIRPIEANATICLVWRIERC